MGAGAANLFGLLFLIPIILFLGIPYYYFWPEQFTIEQLKGYLEARERLTMSVIFIGGFILFVGIVAHEFLHGLGWSFYAKNGWKSISFGMVWKYLTPYCHCSEILTLSAYRFGSLLPAIVLGIFPSLIAIITGQIGLMIFGFFFTFAAAGDFLILWLIRKEKSTDMVQDHQDKIGCVIIRNL